jgi:diguanylate cyclase (GGDEF)-like protein
LDRYDTHQGRVATALRRGEVLDHILWCMAQEVLAPRMMQAALDALTNALGAEGAAVIDLHGEDGPVLMHRAGGAAEEVLPEAAALLAEACGPADATGDDGRPLVAAVCLTRIGRHAGLALWRSPGSRGWDPEDKLLVEAAASLIRMVLDHEAIQLEMTHQARTDPLTGLLNRRAFMDDMARRIDRLDRDDRTGTLMFVDLDHFKAVNDRFGHDVGDQVLLCAANMLRNTLRPSDLVARLGGDEFALWMDGTDHMTAAERAERLCLEVPGALRAIVGPEGPMPTISIGHCHQERRQRGAGRQPSAPGRSGDVRGQADRPRPLARVLRGGDMSAAPSSRRLDDGDLEAGPPGNVAEGEAARVRLGASATTEPGVLHRLAADPSVTVRAALALNPAAPPLANEALAVDPDERVRILLARKLAVLAPSLSAADQAKLRHAAWETLAGLVADEAVRVRATIADAVKELPTAPRELILRLANDAAMSVSEPVIRLSPLLTSDDLLALLANAPSAGTALAVARRSRLDEAVSDAIAASAGDAAIRALLANPSAQIREATLDALVARSVEHIDWHEPLVRRPSLPARGARLLSEIVATHLLEVLAARADLAPALAEDLRRRLAERLRSDAEEQPNQAEPTTEQAVARARALAGRGKLAEEAVLDAARRGEARYAAALLAAAAGISVSVVDRAAALRSAKGLVSLVWKAGFTMRSAVALQSLLGGLAPDAILSDGQGGGFPLGVEEMRWQLEFLSRTGR